MSAELLHVEPLPDPLSGILSVGQEMFPDFEFLAPGGVLRIGLPLGRIDRLRIELPGGQYLHLQSVGVTSDDVDDVASLASVGVSSWYTDYESKFDMARLFAFDEPSGTVIHTQADPAGAWLDISLAHPIEASEIALRNVSTSLSTRARGIRILTGGPDQDLTVVYDSAARQQELEATFDRLLAVRTDLDAESRLLVPVLAKTIAADYAIARTTFDKTEELSTERRKAFRDLVSDELLVSRSLQWTIHGPQRCFRFWTPAQKKNYADYAARVVEDLRDLTTQVCFGFGSALAVVRDGDLIPHDDDLDVIIAFEPWEAASLPAANRLVEEHLRARGYTVSGNFTAHRHVAKPPAKKVDVFAGLFEGDVIAWYPGKRGSLTRSMMFPTSEGTLFGVPVRLPRNPLLYLEQVYGKTWRVPDSGFTHRWNNSAYRDLVKPKSGGS
jgi:hypothetical protein